MRAKLTSSPSSRLGLDLEPRVSSIFIFCEVSQALCRIAGESPDGASAISAVTGLNPYQVAFLTGAGDGAGESLPSLGGALLRTTARSPLSPAGAGLDLSAPFSRGERSASAGILLWGWPSIADIIPPLALLSSADPSLFSSAHLLVLIFILGACRLAAKGAAGGPSCLWVRLPVPSGPGSDCSISTSPTSLILQMYRYVLVSFPKARSSLLLASLPRHSV
jgi:hypothetical protein